jgi:hypothetical protein
MGEDVFDVLRGKLDKIMKGGKPHLEQHQEPLHDRDVGRAPLRGQEEVAPGQARGHLYPEDNALRAILANEDQDEVILRLMRGAGNVVEAKCVEVLVETGCAGASCWATRARQEAPSRPTRSPSSAARTALRTDG